MPKVSVIIPAYNTEKYIAETLESVINQTYNDYEIIVIDDESTDNTVSIVEKYQHDYSNKVKLIKKQNGGPASARNEGIKAATGEFIAFNDADDLWLPRKLEKQMAFFDECGPDVGMVYTDARKFDNEGVWTLPPNMQHRYCQGMIYQDLLKSNFIPNQSVIVRITCFDDVGLLDDSSEIITSEDYDMWLRIAQRFEIEFLNEVLSLYREHSQGINKRADNAIKATIRVIEKHLTLADGDEGLEKHISSVLSSRLYGAGYFYFRVGEMRLARQMIRRSQSLEFSKKKMFMHMLSFVPFGILEFSNRVLKTIRKPQEIIKSKKDFEAFMHG